VFTTEKAEQKFWQNTLRANQSLGIVWKFYAGLSRGNISQECKIVYHDVGYYNIGFVRFSFMLIWLVVIYC
jgi:hypothetical protein